MADHAEPPLACGAPARPSESSRRGAEERSMTDPTARRADAPSRRLALGLAGAAALWLPLYLVLQPAARALAYRVLPLEEGTRLGAAVDQNRIAQRLVGGKALHQRRRGQTAGLSHSGE